jgi:hypothetical protein
MCEIKNLLKPRVVSPIKEATFINDSIKLPLLMVFSLLSACSNIPSKYTYEELKNQVTVDSREYMGYTELEGYSQEEYTNISDRDYMAVCYSGGFSLDYGSLLYELPNIPDILSGNEIKKISEPIQAYAKMEYVNRYHYPIHSILDKEIDTKNDLKKVIVSLYENLEGRRHNKKTALAIARKIKHHERLLAAVDDIYYHPDRDYDKLLSAYLKFRENYQGLVDLATARIMEIDISDTKALDIIVKFIVNFGLKEQWLKDLQISKPKRPPCHEWVPNYKKPLVRNRKNKISPEATRLYDNLNKMSERVKRDPKTKPIDFDRFDNAVKFKLNEILTTESSYERKFFLKRAPSLYDLKHAFRKSIHSISWNYQGGPALDMIYNNMIYKIAEESGLLTEFNKIIADSEAQVKTINDTSRKIVETRNEVSESLIATSRLVGIDGWVAGPIGSEHEYSLIKNQILPQDIQVQTIVECKNKNLSSSYVHYSFIITTASTGKGSYDVAWKGTKSGEHVTIWVKNNKGESKRFAAALKEESNKRVVNVFYTFDARINKDFRKEDEFTVSANYMFKGKSYGWTSDDLSTPDDIINGYCEHHEDVERVEYFDSRH